MSIPGFSARIAEVFIAETGGDMTAFPSAGHLASWAGVAPGCNESAGRVNQGHPPRQPLPQSRPRHRRSIGRTVKGHLLQRQVQTHRRSPRTHDRPGRPEHTMITDAYNMLCNGAFTAILDPTTTPATNPPKTRTEPSSNSKPWATTSHSNPAPKPPNPRPAPLTRSRSPNFRVRPQRPPKPRA